VRALRTGPGDPQAFFSNATVILRRTSSLTKGRIAHAEIRALERAGGTKPTVKALLIGLAPAPPNVAIQAHRLGHAVHGQVTIDARAALAGGVTLCATKRMVDTWRRRTSPRS
jgi:hypothetical protein